MSSQALFLANIELLVAGLFGLPANDWWPGRLKKDRFKVQNVSVRPRELNGYMHRVVLVTC